METIFWLMWLGDAVQGLNSVFAFSAGVFGIGSLICIIISILADPEGCDVQERTAYGIAIKWRKVAIPFFFACMLLSAFMPSQKTVHLMVAAKVGELAVDTRLGKKTIDAAEAVLDKIIRMSKAEAEPKK